MKIQFVWWGTKWQGIGWWEYPQWTMNMIPKIFKGLRLGICEIRFFKQ